MDLSTGHSTNLQVARLKRMTLCGQAGVFRGDGMPPTTFRYRDPRGGGKSCPLSVQVPSSNVVAVPKGMCVWCFFFCRVAGAGVDHSLPFVRYISYHPLRSLLVFFCVSPATSCTCRVANGALVLAQQRLKALKDAADAKVRLCR